MTVDREVYPTPVDLASISREGAKPLYLQIYEQCCALLDMGRLEPGDLFPGEVELARDYGVARITVRRAISDMVREGRLVRRAGKGTFVAQPKIERQLLDVRSFTARMSTLGRHVGGRVLEIKVVPATERLARELAVPGGAPIVVVTRLRLIGDEPMAIESAHFPQALCPGLEHVKVENDASLYQLLDERYGLRPIHSHKTLELAAASPWEARHLNVQSGAPLFLIRATQFGTSGPIEYLKNLLRGDRFRFQIDAAEPKPTA